MTFFQDVWKILTYTDTSGRRIILNYLQGFGNTFILTLVAALIGLVLGFLVAMCKIAAKQNKWMKIPAFVCNVYTTVIRGTPVALQLFIMVFAILAIPGFKSYAAILTFGINSGAYISENIRAGIESVGGGPTEAGSALGLTWGKTMVKIVLPQAVKNIIPAIGNEMIALLKETSIVSIVGSTPGTLTYDLNYAARNAYKSVTNYLACFAIAGCMYLIVVYLMVFLLKIIERRLHASDKR